jgi:4-carboxymuconolactone decarboxylase
MSATTVPATTTRPPRAPAIASAWIGLAAILLSPGAALAEERLPTIPPSQYTPAQREAADAYLAARKVPMSGPFEPMLYSPEMMTRTRAMGDYLRYKSGIGNTLSEFVILITAREWSQDYEWSIHAPIAAKAGIAPAVIAAIRDGRRPTSMSEDETTLYDFVTELLRDKRVSDPTFDRAAKRFGRPAVVDLVGIVGYYALNAMVLNVARFKAPDGTVLPRFPE